MMLSSSSNTARPCINPYQNSRRGNQNESSSLARILASLVAATQGGASSSSSYTRQQWAQLHKALKECTGQWQFSHAVTLLEWVTQQLQQRGNEQHVVRSLDLLATALHEYWGIHLVYAVACPSEENDESPFCFLGRLSGDYSRPAVQSAACLCLAALWRALSQLDVLASPNNTIRRQEDNAWWIQSLNKSSLDNDSGAVDYWTNAIEWSLAQWFLVEADDDEEDDERGEDEQDIIEKEALKYAASVLLIEFLNNGPTSSWLYSMSEGKWLALTERLIEQSQRLLDPNMPMTLFARLSLVSLHLLAVMERKAARDMPHAYEKMLTGNGNGGLVMGMMQSTLQVNAADSAPRWAVDATRWILPILQEWSRTGALTPYWEMDTRSEVARNFTKEVVERVRDGGLVKPTTLASFLWLLRETPALCWNIINHMVPTEHWLDFVEKLVALVLREKTGSAIAPACVLRQVLFLSQSQRRKIDATNSKSTLSFMERLITRASSALERQEDKPLLLSLLDSLKMLSSSCGCGSPSVLNNFVEKLISMISPTIQEMSRTMPRFDSDLSMDSEECTPPVNNLSRLDVSAIMPDASQEPAGTPMIFGLEPCIRIVTANFLAVLINSETERESREFHSQATQALSEFLLSDDMVAPAENILLASSSAVLRRASLLRDVATMEDGNYFVDVFVSLELNRTQAFQQSNAETARLSKRIAWLEQREKQLTKENNALECQIKVQNTSTQRERTRLHRKLVNEANETLKAEMAQRVTLQTEVEDLRIHAKDIGDKLQKSESQKQLLQESEQRLKQELSEKCEAHQILEKEINDVKRERDEDRERVARLSKEVESANAAISSYKKRESQLRDQIAQNEEDLEGLEASRAEMHANLESLFGDMVGLAHAYELKEKEVSSGKESKEATIEKLEKDLDKERQKRKDLEDRYRQVEYENEALSRKYARAREKLEEERKQRSQAFASQTSSRRGDTSKSYIQQLQLSTSRNTSHSSSRSGKENEPRSMRGGSKIR